MQQPTKPCSTAANDKSDDLQNLLASKLKKAVDTAEMKERVHRDMMCIQDTGVRVNHTYTESVAKRQKTVIHVESDSSSDEDEL